MTSARPMSSTKPRKARWPRLASPTLGGGLLLLLVLCAACGSESGPSEPPPPPPGSPEVSFTPASTTPPANSVSLQQNSTSGARLALDVRLTGVENVAALAFDLVFNPQVMNFAEFSEGDFFASGGDVSTQVAENPEGRLIVGVALLGATEGVSGDGVAITLVFNAVSNGGSSFSFENAQLVDPDLNPIAGVQWFGGSAAITGF